jgi:hypothetical protein
VRTNTHNFEVRPKKVLAKSLGDTMSSSSSDAPLKGKLSRAPTSVEAGWAVWSSTDVPAEADPYEASKSTRNNYEIIGDAYDRNQNTANEWELPDT